MKTKKIKRKWTEHDRAVHRIRTDRGVIESAMRQLSYCTGLHNEEPFRSQLRVAPYYYELFDLMEKQEVEGELEGRDLFRARELYAIVAPVFIPGYCGAMKN